MDRESRSNSHDDSASFPHSPPAGDPDTGPADPEALAAVLSLLRQHSGNDFARYRTDLVLARLQRRMRCAGCATLRDYARRLQRDADEPKALFRDLLIGATGFFRDPDSYALLRDTVLPDLLAHRPPDWPLRIWIPGCASGEEAYSVAMTVVDRLRALEDRRAVRILATDIDDRAIATARRGVYSGQRLEAVPTHQRGRFFQWDPAGFRATPAIRQPCLFAIHNLLRDPPFSRLDLVFCRNLLLYLNVPARAGALASLHRALCEDGLLMLGNAERLDDGDATGFVAASESHPIYRRSSGNAGRGMISGHVPTPQHPPADSVRQPYQEAEQTLLAHYAPPGLLVDEYLNIVQFRGELAAFLTPSPTATTDLRLPDMVRPELANALRPLLQQIRREVRPLRHPGLRLRDGGRERTVAIQLLPLPPRAFEPRHFLVLFEILGEHPNHRVLPRWQPTIVEHPGMAPGDAPGQECPPPSAVPQ